MREISRTTVSSKSPRQMIGLRCVRTAGGVGSTGEDAATFVGSVSSCVASASVASASVALVASVKSGAFRKAPRVTRLVSNSVVALLRSPAGEVASSSIRVSPFALLSCWLRRVASSSSSVASRSSVVASVASVVLSRSRSQSLRSVMSRPVPLVGSASGSFASCRPASRTAASSSSCVAFSSVGSVESSPRQVLRSAFTKLSETARDCLSKRLSRRFGSGVTSVSSRASARPVSSRPNPVCVPSVFVPVELLQQASPARARRYH